MQVSPSLCHRPPHPKPPPCLPQYVKVGIADPTINWIDLGASRRSAKTAIGFTGYPVRCARGSGCSSGRCSGRCPSEGAAGAALAVPAPTLCPRAGPAAHPRARALRASRCSIYIRCKNSVQEALYSQMMAIYFKKDELINDP